MVEQKDAAVFSSEDVAIVAALLGVSESDLHGFEDLDNVEVKAWGMFGTCTPGSTFQIICLARVAGLQAWLLEGGAWGNG